MAAGALLITEAGGLVSDLAGEGRYLETGNIVAGSPKIFVELLQTVSRHLTPALKRG
jgi:myo-inositol-1(or 4)-monophosphatase